MIQCIADHVGERIVQLFDHGLVDFGSFTRGDDAHLLAERRGEIAHHPRHPRKDRFDRLGADRHHALLQLARTLRQRLDALDQSGILVRWQARALFSQHRLGNHEFADEVDQAVDLVDIHPDGLGRSRSGDFNRLCCVVRLAGRRNHLLGLDRRRRLFAVNAEFAVIFHELEYFLHDAFGNAAVERETPAEIGGLRIHRIDCWKARAIYLDA